MGIELPPELAPLAAATGVRWPEADEDAMRAAAAAWREAATRMTTLTGDADTTASSAFGAFSGEAADAARAHWTGYVGADSGHLTVTARGCLAAADRLEHAAEQVGAAKVEIVRQLVDLSKNTEAARAVGTPAALLGVDTGVRATAANLAAVTDTLVGAVAPGGPDVTSTRQVAQANPGARPVEAPSRGGVAGGLISGVTTTVRSTVGEVAAGPSGERADGPLGGVTTAVPGVAAVGSGDGQGQGSGGLLGGVTGAVQGAVSGVSGVVEQAVGGTGGQGSGGLLGGVSGAVSGEVQQAVGGTSSGGLPGGTGSGGLLGGVTGAVQGAVGGVSAVVEQAVGGTGGGREGGAGGVLGAVQGAVGGVSGAVEGAVSGIGDVVGGVVRETGGLVGGVTDVAGGVVQGAGELVGGVADSVGGAVRGAGELVGAVADGVGGAADRVGDTAGGGVADTVVGQDAGGGREVAGGGAVESAVRPGPADEWAMDLPTPPAGMPVVETVQAASAAVLDAPAASAQPGGGAAPVAAAPGAAGAAGAVAGVVGGAGGPALPGPRAHSGAPMRADLPQQGDSRAHDQRGQDQRGQDQRGQDQRGQDQRAQDQRGQSGRADGTGEHRIGEPDDASPFDPFDSDDSEPTPAAGFAAVPLVVPPGAFLGGASGSKPFGAPAAPPAERSGLARLPGVFAGAAIGDAHRDQLSLFLLHLFPIGHLPQVVDEPHLQLPAPQAEVDYAAGLRFPPDDHPDARLVDATTPAPVTRTEGGSTARIAEVYDPLGGMHERDWERRFLVRPADGRGRAEYAWPPGEQYPEGGCADGEPVVLEPGTPLDRVGTPEGRVFAEDATPFAARSLPPAQLDAPLRRYTVVRPLPAWRTASAPWFAQRGGGIRLRTTRSAVELVALGYLVEITEDER
ncbi:glycohydrolase toxin TNT-related protein [Actinokineospora guangxiensis]|uniref:Glycohydrolase toxin TNT-related protein n=1 Tax=Actinokineospora guangxiensis TaxID=1490288 RepID=A0ABW0EUK7_9PSEU